jgi:hypothetical protein
VDVSFRLADPFAHDVSARDGVEGAPRLRGEHFGDGCLPGSRRSCQQQARWGLHPEAVRGLGVLDNGLELSQLRLDGGRKDQRVPCPVLDEGSVLPAVSVDGGEQVWRIELELATGSGGLAENLERGGVDDLGDGCGRHSLSAGDELV